MPITLITGLPGHGKSIHAIRLMYKLSKVKEADRKKIYACNFKDLDFDGLHAEEFEANTWMQCDPGKNGGVLFFDEVWEFFESRSAHRAAPEAIKELARHRHYGLDIYMITQGPFQIDSHVRSLIDTHLHCIRPFGMNFYKVRTFQGLERFPDDKQARKRSADTTKKYKFDKKLFGFYRSAEVHTIKRKIPLKMFGAIATLIFALWAIWNLITWGIGFTGDMTDPAKNPISAGIDSGSGSGSHRVQTGLGFLDLPNGEAMNADQLREQFYLKSQPLIKGAPWTAPQYAAIMEAVTFPKPYCALVVESDRCFCHSQQGTTMDVSQVICKNLVFNGFFDPTLEYQPVAANRLVGEGGLTPRLPLSQATLKTAEKIERPARVSRSTNSRPAHTNWTKKLTSPSRRR